jgi:hypothetical protein
MAQGYRGIVLEMMTSKEARFLLGSFDCRCIDLRGQLQIADYFLSECCLLQEALRVLT